MSTFTVAAVAYALLLLSLYFLQSSLIYFPQSRLQTLPSQIGLQYEDVYFDTDDNERLHGWYIPASDAPLTILFFHGNAGNISHRLDSLSIFHELGMNTLIFDYRGFGNSRGSPSESGTYRDALAAWQFLLSEKNEKPQRVVLFGRSIGGAVAAWLATRVDARALILESTFSSLADLGSFHYPYLPVRWLSRYRYDTRSLLPAVSLPVLICHSRDDEIVPFEHARILLAAANPPKQLLELKGGHNDGFLLTRQVYVEGLRQFLATLH